MAASQGDLELRRAALLALAKLQSTAPSGKDHESALPIVIDALFVKDEGTPRSRKQAQSLHDAAIWTLTEWVSRSNTSPSALAIPQGAIDTEVLLGRIAERSGDEQAALRLYARVEDGDNVLAAMLRAAQLLRRSGAIQESELLLDGLLADAPRRAPQILAARAQLYADADDAAHGLEVLRQAIDVYPDVIELRFKRAELLEASRQWRAALKEMEALQRRRPDDPATLNALGYTLADHALQLSRARRLIELAHAQAPQSAAILDSLGWVLYRQGRPAQALPHLTAAFAVDRGAETGAHLGEVLWMLNRREAALQVWEQARREDPGDRVLRATLARLKASR